MSDTYKRHSAAIRHTVTKINIIGIRKALNESERNRRGYSPVTTAPQWSLAQIDAILTDTARYGPIVSGTLHSSGIVTLQRAVKRYKGRFSTLQQAIIADIWHFRLVDWFCSDGWHWFPVYRVTARNGLWFDYINIPWQSCGDGPNVLQCGTSPRVSPMWYCTIAYRTRSGRATCISRTMAGDSWHDMRDTMVSLAAARRGAAMVLRDTFHADFVSMQIGSN